jgi:hypothetical protein
MISIFVIGVILALVAGVSAYLITLQEMRSHFVSASRRPGREALRSGAVTATFFVALAAVLAVALPKMLHGA